MKCFTLLFFIVFFVCNINAQTTSPAKSNTTQTKKKIPKKAVQKGKPVPKEILIPNPNKKIAYLNSYGKVAYYLPRDIIKNYFMSSIDVKNYEAKEISIEKIANTNFYELVIAGINSTTNNGFIISFPMEYTNNDFYLLPITNKITIRGGIGKGCQMMKLVKNDCVCIDVDWLKEENLGRTEYFSFETYNNNFEIKALNFSLDYEKFNNLINLYFN